MSVHAHGGNQDPPMVLPPSRTTPYALNSAEDDAEGEDTHTLEVYLI